MDNRKIAVLVIALGVSIRIALLFWAKGTMIDDAYITLRSAEHLLQGYGLSYNKTVKVLAVSGPLYGYWVALLVAATPFARAGYVIGLTNIGIFAVTAWWFWKLCARAGGRPAMVTLAVFSLFVRFADNSITGMETPLFLFAILVALELLEQRRIAWLSLWLGLSMLIRPEGVLLAAAVILVGVSRGLRPRARDFLPGLAVLAAWVILSYSTFGSPIPQSMKAKSAWFYGANEAGWLGGTRQAFASLSLIENNLRGADVKWLNHLVTVLGFASIVPFAAGLRVFLKRRSVLLVLPVLFIFYLGFYVLGRGSTIFSWYGIPSGLAYLTTTVFGLGALVGRIPRYASVRRFSGPAFLALVLLLTASTFSVWKRHRAYYYRNLRESYGAAGDFVNQVSDPADRVFTAEIGMIGYRARRFVYDMAGLASPEILALYDGRPRSEIMLDALKEYRPEYVVLDLFNVSRLMESSDPAWVQDHYVEIKRFMNHVVLEYSKPADVAAPRPG